MINDRAIFTFWEPKGEMPAYLELCRRTWELNLPDYQIVVLDYSNLDGYFDQGLLDVSTLRRLTLPMQKDAIMVAVMMAHGGVFMDADTLALRDISPITRILRNTQVVMFNTHMGFVAARPNARVLRLWLARIRERLGRLGDDMRVAGEVTWDYVGNSVLREVMDEMVGDLPIMRAIQTKAFEGYGRSLFFRTVLRKYLTMLNRKKYGFIAESVDLRTRRMEPVDRYRRFWFEKRNLDVASVFRSDPMVIGLHHSWTPKWYRELSEQEVLEADCPLSRTLKCILQGG